MSQVDAVYQGGVFKPLGEVDLHENERVRLNFEVLQGSEVQAWLDEVREFQRRIVDARGSLPDSAPDIAEDRLRNE